MNWQSLSRQCIDLMKRNIFQTDDYYSSDNSGNYLYEEKAEEEEHKPDRLTVLLQEIKFNCVKKKDGYYADESVNCEVFHFCQDGAKHSWLCPNGGSFHQVSYVF